MKVCWHWCGGPSYAVPSPDCKPEQFASIEEAKAEFASRLNDPYYPCVENPVAWVWKGQESDEYPDWTMELGPRGGIKLNRV